MKVDIAGVLVDNVTKDGVIRSIDEFVISGKPHYIVTTYSEFVVFANKDPEYAAMLNKADLSIPDGIGILWAAKYLSLNTPTRVGALARIVTSGANLVLSPGSAKEVLKEKVSGSKLIWDIARLASEKNYAMALVGGADRVAQQAASVLKLKYPNLQVNLAVSDKPFDENLVREISESNSDILCLAYSPPKQEKWIAQTLDKLNVKVAIGLGGTFDYLSGRRSAAPTWIINIGLEWFYRLITQPYRWKRMWNAIPVFISIIYKYKLKQNHGKS